ncbi:MrcB family domain-containing protein [uncultured Varibaculum sp.]|uniref:MrcB family domain-containing protein n=1 Tax=uncultured Varibaculum sp. TaxID=413896 RepID=UPI0027D9A358|nr:DUF3578 domain-containing protein [uncultured Varibaculum sp.]
MADTDNPIQSLREILLYLLENYKSIRDDNSHAGEPQTFLGTRTRNFLENSGYLDNKRFKAVASAGQGTLASVPWVGVFYSKYFDLTRPSAKSGYYVVYLLNEAGNKVYLTLNQGTSDVKGLDEKARFKDKLEELKNRASEIAEKVHHSGFSSDPITDLGKSNKAKEYSAAAILHKVYTLDQLPDEESLANDLETMVNVYSQLIEQLEKHEFSGGIQAWLTASQGTKANANQDIRECAEENGKEGETVALKLGKNIILYGPPGTGKTYNTVIYAVAICERWENLNSEENQSYGEILSRYNDLVDEGRVAFTTFHQSYGYEEFIEGISPKIENLANDSSEHEPAGEIAFSYRDGLFKNFCRQAREKDQEPCVFVIDEINRGNISKIFGELITLIEESKREGEEDARSALLPYTGEQFSVPNNIYLLGTMNTADRSIALMDTALRRRFHFIEMQPDPQVLKDFGASEIAEGEVTLDVARMLEVINQRIELLYDREHTIGHAFFTSLKDNPTIEHLAVIFKDSIIPLLFEYFYEDYEKIRMVLGDNSKSSEDLEFLTRVKTNKEKIFNGGMTDIDLPDVYKLNHKALGKIESYLEIYSQ